MTTDCTWRRVLQIFGPWLALGVLCAPSLCVATYWDAELLARAPTGQVRLMNGSGEVALLETRQIKFLVEAKERIQGQAKSYAKFLIVDDRNINAFANSYSGQHTVTITIPMLKALSLDKDAMAALFGHELAHIVKEHGSSRTRRSSILELLGALAGIALEARTQSRWGVLGVGKDLSDLGTALAVASFTRDDEREADELGIRWMISAGYDPYGGVRLQRIIAEQGSQTASFLSTHPSSDERIANIERLISERGGHLARQQELKPAPASFIFAGQIGVVISVNDRHRYVIFSGTTASTLVNGTAVYIETISKERIRSRISRSVDGYYSSVVGEDALRVSVGSPVFLVE